MFKLIVIVIQLSLFNLINCHNHSHSHLNDDALRVVSIYVSKTKLNLNRINLIAIRMNRFS